MASTTVFSAPEKFLANPDFTFEELIKKSLNWTRDDWNSNGMDNTIYSRLIASLKYWSRQLDEALNGSNIVFTTFNVSREAYIDLDDMIDAILDLDSSLVITGYNRFENKRYLCVQFQNKTMREFVMNNLKKIKDDNVVYIDWVGQANIFSLKLLWLPNHLDINKIYKFLQQFVEILDMQRIDTKFRRGITLPCGDLQFKCKLLKNVNISQIPHFCTFGKLKGFIIVQGREQICLTCLRVGHLSYHCPTPFCRKCRTHKPTKHDCTEKKTYAELVTVPSITLPNSTEHRWGDYNPHEDYHSLLNPVPDSSPSIVTNSTNNQVEGQNMHLNKSTLSSSDLDHIQFPPLNTNVIKTNVNFSDPEVKDPNNILTKKFSSTNLSANLSSQPTDSKNIDEQDTAMEYGYTTVKRKHPVPSPTHSDSEESSSHDKQTYKEANTYSKFQPSQTVKISNLYDTLANAKEEVFSP